MRLTTKCDICGKNLITRVEVPFLNADGSKTGRRLHVAKCGHVSILTKLAKIDNIEYNALDDSGHHARDYQKQGIDFLIDTSLNGIIGDQMRLGKTPQSLLAVRNAANAFPDTVYPLLIVVKSANLWQWIPEYKKWTDNSLQGIFPIVGTKSWIPPGFNAYIISMDTFGRKGMAEKLSPMGFKTIIVDEAHSFKNTDSNRSQALVDFIKHNRIEHKIFLTGTPIKNRADEFFVLLNLCAPNMFTSLESFRRNWCERDDKGRYSRISRFAIEAFRERISPFYLRREKEDVYDDLPALDRIFTVIKIEDAHYKKIYNQALGAMEDKINADGGKVSFMSLQGELMFLRRICGMAKVQFITDYVDVFLETSESAKLAIGIHHEDVRETLKYNLETYKPLTLSGEDNAERKYRIMQAMAKENNRLLIANMLAGGVGMDFHHIDNALIAERAWNPADEEQFEFRFYNPDKSIKNRPTTIEYMIADGTIDYFFHDMVRNKRSIFGETVGTNWSLQQDEGSFKDLIEQTLSGRL